MIPQDTAPAILEGDVIDLLRSLPSDSNPFRRHIPSILGAPRLRSPTGPVGREGAV